MSTGAKIDDMEAHIEKLDLELTRLRTKMEEHQEAVRDIDSKLDSILNEMSRYKGFLGGIVFVCSCLWAFVKMVGLAWLKK